MTEKIKEKMTNDVKQNLLDFRTSEMKGKDFKSFISNLIESTDRYNFQSLSWSEVFNIIDEECNNNS